MKAFLNSLQERFLVQKNNLLSDHDGGFKEAWQEIGSLWVKRKLISPLQRRFGKITWGYCLGAKYLEDPLYLFLARREILIKAGMRLKGRQTSYAVLEDAQDLEFQGWQQFCGVALQGDGRG